jgi:putative addiction module killer protein
MVTFAYHLMLPVLEHVDGAGVFEYRIGFGPGYRVYFGKDGDAVVSLVGGGTKNHQDRDIAIARHRWADYKKRRTQEK